MFTHIDFLRAHFPGDIAKGLSVTPQIVNGWIERDSIPAGYWIEFSDWSNRNNVSCSVERLALAAHEKRKRRAA